MIFTRSTLCPSSIWKNQAVITIWAEAETPIFSWRQIQATISVSTKSPFREKVLAVVPFCTTTVDEIKYGSDLCTFL